MKILFIAPLPPPTHRQSLASKVFYGRLRKEHEVRVVNMAKRSAKRFRDKVCRFGSVAAVLLRVASNTRGVDRIYLSLSESILGNTKDLCIYAICHRQLDRMIVHMLGGAGMKRILQTGGLRYRLNRFVLGRVRGIVVEGAAQAAMFSAVTDPEKIHIVPNFAQDYLFATPEQVARKFASMERINLLFLSNMLYGKGHVELVEGYLRLSERSRERIRLDFVGGFGSASDERAFLDSIKGHGGLAYLGPFIGGERKRALYDRTHVVCLPTYYPYEGQPITILEAYATGCAVLATPHSGIPDIFMDRVNGVEVVPRSSQSITAALEQIVRAPESLREIALANLSVAVERYRTATYQRCMMHVVHGTHGREDCRL